MTLSSGIRGAAGAAGVLVLSVCCPVQAGEASGMPADFLFYEWRFGGFAHDPGGPDAGGIDVNTEVLFAKPWGTQAEWWLPRPHLGATISLDGRTSTVYGGATWQVDLTSSLFAEASFGASLNNAATVDEEEADALGCTALFRSSASLGYRMTAHWSVMASVEHSSNAGLCDRNRGLTNAGLRLGYRF